MDASHCSSAQGESVPSFGRTHFGGCVLGDKRLVERAVVTADAMLARPGGTLPAKLRGGQLTGFYDLANNARVTHANLLAAHTRRTLDLIGRYGKRDGDGGDGDRGDGDDREGGRVVLLTHDTTEADFSGLSAAGLGQLGDGHGYGLLVHNVLAVDYARREVLGLAAQFTHVRRKVNRKEGLAASRAHPQRESRLWVKGVEAVGPPPPGVIRVNLMDRGGDSFECLDRQHRVLRQLFIVRSRNDRNVRVADKAGRVIRRRLHAWARKLPSLGTRELEVAGNDGQRARTATVCVSAGPVEVQVPNNRYGEHGDDPLALWVVRVWEVDPPAGQEPLEWILLTNVPTASADQAWERVDWYARRPVVEELHKAMKTGCGMELMQFTTRKALEVGIAMLSVVAVQLLRLRDLARQDDEAGGGGDAAVTAVDVVGPEHVEALSLWRWQEVRPDLTAREFLAALGRLGGHLGRRGDGPPGWLVLWRGWTELQRMVEAIRLVRLERSG
jgi:hypothetical protein